MGRPSESTVKYLFATSGNACAFPNCELPIVDPFSKVPTGIICHIKARSPRGPRYDPNQTEDERHRYDNLLLLCSHHSKVIDTDKETYTIEMLRNLKAQHEVSNNGNRVSLDDSAIERLLTASDLLHNSLFAIPFVKYERVGARSLAIGPWHLSRKWLKEWLVVAVFAGLLIVGSMFTTFQHQPIISTLLSIVCMATLLVGYLALAAEARVRNSDFSRFCGVNIECDEVGQLYLTEIEGLCPTCGSKILLEDMPKGSNLKVMGICQANSELHTFSFDHTILEGTYSSVPARW